MKYLFILINLFFVHYFSVAQKEDNETKKISFVFKLDNRFSYAANQSISIYGFRTGIRLFGKHEVGIGLNWLGSRNVFDLLLNKPDGSILNGKGRLFYRYLGLFYEPILYNKKRWTISFPIQFGGGKAGAIVSDAQNNHFIERRESSYLITEPSLNIDYKFWRYLGVGTGAGYRFAFSKQEIVQNNLTRPVFILKLKIYLMEFFKKEKK